MAKIGANDEVIIHKNPIKETPVNLVDEETLARMPAPVVDNSERLVEMIRFCRKTHDTVMEQTYWNKCPADKIEAIKAQIVEQEKAEAERGKRLRGR
jgi:hypothetical protein